MAFCGYCGNEVAEGELCSCQQGQNECHESQAQYASDEDAVKNNSDKGGKAVIGVIAAVIVLIVVLLFVLILGGSGYKKVVKELQTALNEADGDLIMNIMCNEDMLDDMEDYFDDSWYYDDLDEYINDMENDLDDLTDSLEDEFGKNLKISIKITDRKKLDEDDIEDDIEDVYKKVYGMRVKVAKAYKLNCEVEVKGKDGEDDKRAKIIVFKTKDGEWKLFDYAPIYQALCDLAK